MSSSLPRVIIVGRPNVGKSTLFNRMAGRRISIVAPEEGVTRDWLSATVEARGKHFEIVDTAGAFLSEQTDAQTERAVKNATLVFLVVDVNAGLLSGDESIAGLLRDADRKTAIIANKADNPRLADNASEFHRLGIHPVIPCSAKHGMGLSDLTAYIAEKIPKISFVPQHEIDVAIVGRRNAGKSTLLNHIAGEERSVVSEIPGTTRDNVDFTVTLHGRTITFVDTAGMLRKSRIKNGVEFYSIVRSREAVQKCDVCLFLLDCTRQIGRTEKLLASHITKCRKPCILIFNKWDVLDNPDTRRFQNYVSRQLPQMFHCPISFASALTGSNVKRTLSIVSELYDMSRTQIPTPKINKVLQKITERTPPPARKGKRFRVFYATQTDIQPPTFTLFVNDPKLVSLSYRRFLERGICKEYQLDEVPISLRLRKRR